MNERDLADDLFFSKSMGLIDSDVGTFGDFESLSIMLRDLVGRFLALDTEAARYVDLAESLARGAAAAMLSEGGRSSSERVGAWWRPGSIDLWLRARLGIEETDAVSIIAAYLLELFVEISAIVDYASDPKVLDEQWKWQVDAAVEEWALTLIGAPPQKLDENGDLIGGDGLPEVPSGISESAIEEVEDLVTRLYEGGVGSGITGHTTAKKTKPRTLAEPHRYTQYEYMKELARAPGSPGKEAIKAYHRRSVKKVLLAGHSLSDEIMKDYPEWKDYNLDNTKRDPSKLLEGWVTINTDDDGCGGQKIYIDASGKIQSGHFTGKSLSQAFGGKGKKDKPDKSGSSKSSASTPAMDKPKAEDKPESHDFGSINGGKAKSTNDMLNDFADGIDEGTMGLMFDNVPGNEHDALAKAIGEANPKMKDAAEKYLADSKAENEKWQKEKAAHDELMSVHPSLKSPSGLNKTKVKAAFKDIPPEKHQQFVDAVSQARPELADHAKDSMPKAKKAKVEKAVQAPAATPAPMPLNPAAAPKPKVAPVPAGLDSFEMEKAAKWKQAVEAGKADSIATAGALNGIESDEAKAYHAKLLKDAGVKKNAVSEAPKPIPSSPTNPSSPKQLSDDFQAYMDANTDANTLAFDEYDFAKLPKQHQTEFNALSSFVAGGFTGMNANPNDPASVKFNQLLDKLPDAKPKTIHRVLAFDSDEARQSFIDSIKAPHGQEKAFSSWTKDDPSLPGASAKTHIGLDVASQFGEHELLLKYEQPTGAKDISFAYGAATADAGAEYILRKGHQLETKSISKDVNGRTVVTLGPPSEKPKASSVVKSKAKVIDAEGGPNHPANKKTMAIYKSLVPNEDINPATLVGAPDKSKVTYSRGPYDAGPSDDDADHENPSVIMSVEGDGIDAMIREITTNSKGQKVMINHELFTSQPGLGRKILKNQIAAAQAAGISEIKTTAIGVGQNIKGSENMSTTANGYYTWPRYGYDATIDGLRDGLSPRKGGALKPNDVLNNKKHEVLDTIKSKFGAKSLSDVMATKEGRDFWKANGFEAYLTFDLSPGSRSTKIFNAYLKAKGEL